MARWFRCGLSVAGPFAPVARRCGWVPGGSTAAPRRESFARHDGSGRRSAAHRRAVGSVGSKGPRRDQTAKLSGGVLATWQSGSLLANSARVLRLRHMPPLAVWQAGLAVWCRLYLCPEATRTSCHLCANAASVRHGPTGVDRTGAAAPSGIVWISVHLAGCHFPAGAGKWPGGQANRGAVHLLPGPKPSPAIQRLGQALDKSAFQPGPGTRVT